VELDRYAIGKIAAVVGVGVCAYLVYKKLQQRSVEQRWVQVGTISELFIFPIKSFKGRSVQELECLSMGPKSGEYYDRRFVVADSTGKFLTAREAPKMVLIEPKVENDVLTLVAPNKESVSADLNKVVANGRVTRVTGGLWETMPADAFDCGDEIANWICDYVGKADNRENFRLYYHTPGLYNSRSLDNYPKLKGLFGKRNDLAIFSDFTTYMLMTESSMTDLNTHTPNGEQFSIRNFRPNFIVAGTKAFDEDKWAKVRIGEETSFTNVIACTRCLLTTVNWATGEKHPRSEPLRTLRSYRVTKNPEEKKYLGASPLFGIYLVIDRLGRVKVGDPVYVTYKSGY